ncbi:hypothetical protein [Parasedimentitalea psychrophila]|uniref:Uncharacterized protein n=1 Tax=Parasedimentitalea psychrophila TaxID=2997337 RepID=A0A9Y2L0C0_9RHOB|nr:hypothetical protein [Parasedimentitalea psychrophila]WIY25978.1 hypothetical protein QPJ95_03305 [Parasedimentitalea psychrophila]
MWRIQAEGVSILGEFLQDCRAKAGEGCDTVLLSGEDFENAIVDLTLASEIETLARDIGFSEVIWVVVDRDKHDYAASIYAEMSRHGVVLQRSVVAEALKKRGCLYVSTHNFNYIFALDFARFKERFRASLNGELVEYSMNDFVADRPGSILLKRLMTQSRYEEFMATAEFSTEVANQRISSRKVEKNYLATALNLTAIRRRIFPWNPIVALLATLRS